VEAVAGFGGTVLALSLGARWFGIEALLAWLLPLNLGLSAALALRGRRVIAWRTLGTAILPMIFDLCRARRRDRARLGDRRRARQGELRRVGDRRRRARDRGAAAHRA
jgi:hypothetical protein